MFRICLLSACLGIAAAAGQAGAPRDQLRAAVAMELPNYIRGVDTASLSLGQLGAIYAILYGSRSTGDKRNQIRSVLGGPYSLRGVLLGRY